MELKYSDTDDSDIEATYISEITAAFTTANARMRLHDSLAWLHLSQICYCDTDSVMFIYNKTNPLHKYPANDTIDLPKRVKFGKGLGEWENELKEGEFINEFVFFGVQNHIHTKRTLVKLLLNKKE